MKNIITITITKKECDLLLKLIGFEVDEVRHTLEQAKKDGLPTPEGYLKRYLEASVLGDKLVLARDGK